MHGLAASDDEQPGRVAVQPVDDPRAPFVATGDAGGERLRERPGSMAPRGMHDHAGRLVDHQQVLVLVGDRERRLRNLGLGDGAARGSHRHALARRHGVPLRPRDAVHQHQPVVDQPLRSGARPGVAGEEDIEPLARRVRLDHQLAHGARGPSST